VRVVEGHYFSEIPVCYSELDSQSQKILSTFDCVRNDIFVDLESWTERGDWCIGGTFSEVLPTLNHSTPRVKIMDTDTMVHQRCGTMAVSVCYRNIRTSTY